MDRAEVTMTDVAAMRSGVRALGEMVRHWSDMIEQINRASGWTPSDVKGFNRAAKEEIERSLDAAAEFLRRGRNAHTDDEILAKIAEVRAVVGAAEAYVEVEVPEVTNKIEKPAEMPFHVLKKWKEDGYGPGGEWIDYYEERDYPEGAPNGQGRYQLWKNGWFESKSAPPRGGTLENAGMGALLRRLEVLK